MTKKTDAAPLASFAPAAREENQPHAPSSSISACSAQLGVLVTCPGPTARARRLAGADGTTPLDAHRGGPRRGRARVSPPPLHQRQLRFEILRLELGELGIQLVLVQVRGVPHRLPRASCTCHIFSLCSLMSSITLSTSSMLVSRCSCFIAPAPS